MRSANERTGRRNRRRRGGSLHSETLESRLLLSLPPGGGPELNSPPTADAGGPYLITEGQDLVLLGSGTDPDEDTLTFSWDVNGDGVFDDATGDSVTLTWQQLNALGINDGPATFNVRMRSDDGQSTTTSAPVTLTVDDTSPAIALSGNATLNEGSMYTLQLGPVVDPGDDTVTRYVINWGDGSFDDVNGDPSNTSHTHIYTNGPSERNIRISLFDEDALPHADVGNPNPFTITVLNVPPTATFFNGGGVSEGSGGFVGFAGQFDPSPADTMAGFRYSYDFNNDGDFADPGEFSDIVNASVGVPAMYLNDGPSVRTVRGRIKDQSGGFTDYTTSITVFNVTPFVNAGPDIQIPATMPINQVGSFVDTAADAPFVGMVDYDWNPGDNDAVPLPLNNFSFTLNRTYNTPGTYTIRVFVTDKDGATGHDDVIVTVGPAPTLQASQFLVNASGFTLRFNRAIDTSVLNLYDGLDGINPSSEPADVTLVGNTVGAVRGSLVWNPATNTATFVRTGGPLSSDTYVLTVRSGANALKDMSGELLDGDADGTAGGDFVTVFNVTNQFQRTLSIPDFARGPNAEANINVPNTGAAGIPVRIDDGTQVRSVDFTINYNPTLLNITGAELAAGMPGDWALTANLTAPGTAVITVFGLSTDLPAGPRDLVKLVAHVPAAAPYPAAGVLRISNITVSRNNATTLTARGDSALQVVSYFGDADADGTYTGFDAALVSRVVVGSDSGFHNLGLIDPIIIADIDRSNTLTGIDASFVAQKAAGLPRAEIPDLPSPPPGSAMARGGGGVGISVPIDLPGSPGKVVTMPIQIDDATNTLGFNVTVDYDTQLLDVTDDIDGVSPAVRLGMLYANAGGWTVVTNVDDANGKIQLVFYRATGVPMSSGGGDIAQVDFNISSSADDGIGIPIDLGGSIVVGGLSFIYQSGSIRIDAVAPTVLADNYRYQTAPHRIEVRFSENVSASLAAGDFTVVNTSTSTTLPASDFVLSFDPASNTATLTYTRNNGVLPDGNYTLTVHAAGVTDPAGNTLTADHTFGFFFLMADANHDGLVNLADFNILAANFGQSGRNFTQGDFNYDGLVNLADFNILAARFGTALSPGATPRASTGGAPAPGSSPRKAPTPFADTRIVDDREDLPALARHK